VKPYAHLATLVLLLSPLAGCTGWQAGTSGLPVDGENGLTGKLVLTGSSTVAPLATEIAARFETLHPEVRVDVQTGGSSRGIADALSGVADLGMASRALKAEETAQGLEEHRIAVDGIGLIVHADNPLTALTKQQTVDVFTGKTASWQDLGGGASEIVVVNKAEGRATLEVFLGYFELENSQIEADVVAGDNQQVILTVSGNPAAIGYVSIGEAAKEIELGTPIRLIAAGEIEPTTENVAGGSYPVTRPLNLITHGETSRLARAFIEFAQSEEVHDLVEQQGFTPASR